MNEPVDAVVVGAGPNGLAAAITLAEAGRSVIVYEAHETPGGGARSAELTEPGFIHDVCSAVHALGVSSPFFLRTPLADHGLEWVHPEIPLAHPLDDRPAAALHRSVDETAAQFGPGAARYRRLVDPLLDRWDALGPALLRPQVRFPDHPLVMARFAAKTLLPATRLGSRLGDDRAAALLAGCAAHAFLPLTNPLTGAFGLTLMLAGHAAGWPVAVGGTQSITDAMVSYLQTLGGEVVCGRRIGSLDELPAHRAVMFDTDPRQLESVCGEALPSRYRKRLRRYRFGPAAFKVDYALDAPVPWFDDACRRAGTVHVGGSLADIAAAEADVARGRMPEQPFVLVAQQSLADTTRAPAGKHTLWAYAHVPAGYDGDATQAIDDQIERFAPGFRDVVRARHVTTPAELERYNPNNRGGDIAGGSHAGLQFFLRPALALRSYRTPNPSVFLCSASTPPGGGVHGMCGANAAHAALAGVLH